MLELRTLSTPQHARKKKNITNKKEAIKDNIMEKYFKPILAVFLYLIIQAIVSVTVIVVVTLCVPEAREAYLADDTVNALNILGEGRMYGIITILSGFASCAFVYYLGIIHPKTWYSVKNIDWKLCSLAFVSSIAIIFALDIFSEFIEIPDLMKDEFQKASQDPWGILAIAIFGPFFEEFVLREGVTGYLLRRGTSVTSAVLFSALIFGIMHLNPLQILFASFTGVVLAIVYVKTGSIIIPYIIHMTNNLVSVILMNIYGDRSDNLIVDELGDYTAFLLMTIAAILGIIGLKYFWDKHPSQKFENDDLTIAVY